ncbi:MAG: phage tail tape measure protein [Shinella sp.]|nr:MAG: phage tail tape measure protein [Shinella sp.]
MGTLQSMLRVSLLDDVSGKARHITRALDGLRAQQMSTFAPMRSLIGQTIALGAGYLGGRSAMSATAGAAIEFETAFADVKKVVEATDEQFENMRRGIRAMSGEIPMASTEIAALFAAAGEAGIATEDLRAFSEMAARVGIAFDMTAEQAGGSLASLKTQLNLSVSETALFADAINHLSNNMASSAKDVTEFMLRVGSFGEMGGFAKEELAAMGSAMIAAGSDASTAGTAMLNVIRSLTKGGFAKKSQQDAAKALGLHLPSIAKDMQKDAKGTLRKVLMSVAAMPKENQVALLSEFFGDEARAFMPLVGNIKLLDQALASVADRTQYAGSAFREYVERANTTQNILDLLRNKFSNKFAEMGDAMLPSIREGAIAIGEVLDSLGERASVFDKVRFGLQGFLKGFGYDGGIKEMVHDIADLLLGPASGDAADKIGRTFMQAKEWGASIRALSDAIRESPITQFMGELAPYGFKLFLWGTGIAFLATTVRKLAGAVMLLSGASTLIGVLKTLGKISAIASGGKGLGAAAAGAAGVVAGTAGKGQGRSGGGPGLTKMLMGPLGMASLVSDIPDDKEGLKAFFDASAARSENWNAWLEKSVGSPSSWLGLNKEGQEPFWKRFMFNKALEPGFNFREHAGIDTQQSQRPTVDVETLRAAVQSSGPQDVRVTNPQAPNVTVHAPITITGVTDPRAAADAALAQLGAQVKNAAESSFSD